MASLSDCAPLQSLILELWELILAFTSNDVRKGGWNLSVQRIYFFYFATICTTSFR